VGEYLDKIIDVFIAQGIAGVMLIVVIYGYYLRGKKLDEKDVVIKDKDTEIKDLHKEMLKAAEDDNHEKIEYLNQHLVLLTKTKETMAASSTVMNEVKAKQDQVLTDLAQIKGKLNNG